MIRKSGGLNALFCISEWGYYTIDYSGNIYRIYKNIKNMLFNSVIIWYERFND